MSRITLTLEDALGEKLREKAKSDDRSMSSVARLALAKHFGITLGGIPTPKKKKGGGK